MNHLLVFRLEWETTQLSALYEIQSTCLSIKSAISADTRKPITASSKEHVHNSIRGALHSSQCLNLTLFCPLSSDSPQFGHTQNCSKIHKKRTAVRKQYLYWSTATNTDILMTPFMSFTNTLLLNIWMDFQIYAFISLQLCKYFKMIYFQEWFIVQI